MAAQLTWNQRLWLSTMYASEYTATMHQVNYLRQAAEGLTDEDDKREVSAEADEREGYARHLAALRDACGNERQDTEKGETE